MTCCILVNNLEASTICMVSYDCSNIVLLVNLLFQQFAKMAIQQGMMGHAISPYLATPTLIAPSYQGYYCCNHTL